MANNIKGLTVEIGGDTTKLSQALADVNKKSKDLSGELGEINKLLRLDPGNTELLAQKQKVLGDAIKNTAEKLSTLKEAEKQVQAQFERGEVSEAQVRALQREIIETENKMDGYKKAAKETAEQTNKIGQAAKEVGAKLATFGKAVADVAAKSLAAMGTAAAAAATALGKATIDAAAYADDILTTSTVTGIATDKLQGYSYAAELVDVSVDTLTKSMAKNIKSMKGVQDGTKLSVEAYEKLGVKVLDANGNMRDGETVYWEVIDALGKMENETERDALAMQVLGKSAQELNPLIEAGAGKMQELTAEAEAVGAVMSEDTLAAFGAFDDSLQRLKGSAGAAKNALGGVLLPEMQMLTDTGGALLAQFTQELNNSGGGLDGFVQSINAISGELVNTVSTMAAELLETISALAPSLVSTATSLVASLAETIISMLPELLTTGVEMIVAILDGVTSTIPQVVDAIVKMIPRLVDALVDGIPQIINGAVKLLLAIIDAIPKILPPLVAAIPQIVMSIINALIGAIPQLVNGAVKFLTAIINAIPIMIQSLIPQIPSIVNTIINQLLGMAPVLLQAAITLMFAIVKAIPQICASLAQQAPSIITTIVSALASLPKKMASIGTDLVKGLWNGIKDMTKWITGKLKGFGDDVLKGIKNFFGIKSPSRVFKNEVGKMLAVGLAEGIEDNANQPLKAMQSLSSDLMGEAGEINGLTFDRRVQHTFGATEPSVAETGVLGKLDKILRAIERGQILTINGDTLVGATVGSMDSALGQRRVLAERGAM